jgi:hypothetical protein
MSSQIETQSKVQQPVESSSNSIIEYSQEFKLEMENSICHYFSNLDNKSIKSNIDRNETLVNNTGKDIEYITPTPSLKGISDFMIDQIFSTEKIIPVESDDEDSKLEATENKMNSCNSDLTLNNNVEDSDNEDEEKKEDILSEEDGNISKSFAIEFIDLLNINMKELNSKKDNFEVIGLKKIDENTDKVLPDDLNEASEIKFADNIKEKKSKSKKTKHISIFNMDKKSSHLHRSKSTSTTKSSSSTLTDSMESLTKEVKSKFGLSKIFRTVKKRMQKN